MKNLMIRAITLLLLISMSLGCAQPAFAKESDFTCDNYAECTENGAKIYMITKNNCPIRKEPHNKGEVVARGQKGQLISVSKVFWTKKMTRWCEINVIGSKQKLYIYIDNCQPHVHSYVTLLSNDKGYVNYCAMCGIAVAKADKQAAACDFTCVVDQAVKGSFSAKDSTFAGVLAQIVAGELLGPIADARDLVGDILKGESGWIIATDLMALIPLVGALKYSDELVVLGKNSDKAKHLDDFAKAGKKAGQIPWGKWSDYTKVRINGKEYAKIGKFHYTKHAVDEFMNPSIQTNLVKGVEHSRGIPPSYVNWVLTTGVENGTTKIGKPYYRNGAQRVKYSNGSLEIIVEAGNIVVTIIPK